MKKIKRAESSEAVASVPETGDAAVDVPREGRAPRLAVPVPELLSFKCEARVRAAIEDLAELRGVTVSGLLRQLALDAVGNTVSFRLIRCAEDGIAWMGLFETLVAENESLCSDFPLSYTGRLRRALACLRVAAEKPGSEMACPFCEASRTDSDPREAARLLELHVFLDHFGGRAELRRDSQDGSDATPESEPAKRSGFLFRKGRESRSPQFAKT